MLVLQLTYVKYWDLLRGVNEWVSIDFARRGPSIWDFFREFDDNKASVLHRCKFCGEILHPKLLLHSYSRNIPTNNNYPTLTSRWADKELFVPRSLCNKMASYSSFLTRKPKDSLKQPVPVQGQNCERYGWHKNGISLTSHERMTHSFQNVFDVVTRNVLIGCERLLKFDELISLIWKWNVCNYSNARLVGLGPEVGWAREVAVAEEQ